MALVAGSMALAARGESVTNVAFRLEAASGPAGVTLVLQDAKTGTAIGEAAMYEALRTVPGGAMLHRGVEGGSVVATNDALTIRGKLAGLDLEQCFVLPADQPWMEETITVTNRTSEAVRLEGFEIGFVRRIASQPGQVLRELREDRVTELPFRRRPTDREGQLREYGLQNFLDQPGEVRRFNPDEDWEEAREFPGRVPSRHRSAEGWCWTHTNSSFCCFKFNQESMEFSVVSTVVRPDGVALRFGGACLVDEKPSRLLEIAAGAGVRLGVTRYQSVAGTNIDGLYALREFLDDHGCRFPTNYHPLVHWNELYDNPFYNAGTPGKPAEAMDDTRTRLYTRAMMEEAAAQAKAYHCEALYMDPGWDSNLGTFIWGEKWLGPRADFVRRMKSEYGLGVSLHCAMSSWMSDPFYVSTNPGIASFPAAAFRKDSSGNTLTNSLCTGSRQYLEPALKRMLENCADGVRFLMLDGNWYQGGCWDPAHGHPVPYRPEDQATLIANLARDLHARYPNLIIEMHDPITGGNTVRLTPLYYQYGLPGCFDENWGFELMWAPMKDLRTGAARALYYYDLGCNVPAYLHVDLRGDNENALVFWWYASTCRHLGIGGTHPNPLIASLHQREMARYRQWEPFFQRGDFYGAGEEIHLHVLPGENAFVAVVFNLSDEPRRIRGDFEMKKAKGLPLDRYYSRTASWGDFDRKGLFKVRLDLPPWSVQAAEFRVVPESAAGDHP